MRSRILVLLALCSLVSPAQAQTFTSMSAWLAQAGLPTYTETFESVPVAKEVAHTSFTQAGITYVANPGFNVIVAAPGHTNFGAGLNPTTTSILSGNGLESFRAVFSIPEYAVGFDAYYNGLGNATATFFNGASVLATISYNGPAFLGFDGYIADSNAPVTSIEWVSTQGNQLNTGIDNLMVSSNDLTTTPEPASLILLATGLAGIAVGRRRRSGDLQAIEETPRR